MKPGRVVILLAGRHAGQKAIIVRQHDDGKKVSDDDVHTELTVRLFRRESSHTLSLQALRDTLSRSPAP